MFRSNYADVYAGDERWNGLEVPEGDLYDWRPSTYVKRPPYFEGMPASRTRRRATKRRAVLAVLGDSVTTDHISPAGAIRRTARRAAS